MDDCHGAPTEHERGTDHQWEADTLGHNARFVCIARNATLRLTESELLEPAAIAAPAPTIKASAATAVPRIVKVLRVNRI